MKGNDHAEELRAMAQGVFRGLREEAALLSGAEALEARADAAARAMATVESWAIAGVDGGVWSLASSDGRPRLFRSRAEAESECLSQQRPVRVRVRIVEVTT